MRRCSDRVSVGAVLALLRCTGADVSDPADHRGGAVPGRRPDRRHHARISASGCGKSLGQPLVVEICRRVRAARVGADRVARAAPDGYTIICGHIGTHVINGAVYQPDVSTW